MGDFTVVVKAIGGHGCQRDKKDGSVVENCGFAGCPDCAARDFVKRLMDQGQMVTEATLTHWPNTDVSVVDDLLSKKRSGSF